MVSLITRFGANRIALSGRMGLRRLPHQIYKLHQFPITVEEMHNAQNVRVLLGINERMNICSDVTYYRYYLVVGGLMLNSLCGLDGCSRLLSFAYYIS